MKRKFASVAERTGDCSVFEYLLTHYRGLFATVVLLPASLLYEAYATIRNRILFYLTSAPARHDLRVQRVIRQIEEWRKEGCKKKLCTARSGWKSMSELVPKYKLSHQHVHIGMHDILQIDEDRRVVKVEPLATMGQISRALVSRGWMLAVVPELDDLTVGGLIMGFGVETSSHKFGLFQHICESFDVVTAEGKLLRCSRSENVDLYYLLPWSHGTLGFLVAATLKIIPARKYVKVRYQPLYTLDEAIAFFVTESRDGEKNDFVEGILYRCHAAVIMCGQLTDELGSDGMLNPLGRWPKPWFYQHVQTYLHKRQHGIEYIPLRDYFHRHTRSYFWAMEDIIAFGNHPVFRWLLGWALPPSIQLLKYTETETTRRLREKHHVIQDMLVPLRYLKKSLQYLDAHYQLYPLWLCPLAIHDNDRRLGFIHPFRNEEGEADELYVDIGAYGTPAKENFDNRSALPALEAFVIEHHGYQALYAETKMTREQFRTMFDHRDYDRLRAQLPFCKQAFDEVYDKVSHRGRTSPAEMRKLKTLD